MTGLRIEKPGPRTTVQDMGRFGYQHQGLSVGGAKDLRAWRWANHLLDNPTNAACLEVTWGGFSAIAESCLLMAVTGAADQVLLNDQSLPSWSVFLMRPGDHLQVSASAKGLLTYLAVAGGWQTREFLGSRSVVIREQLTDLGNVQAGVLIPAQPYPQDDQNESRLLRRVPPAHRSLPQSEIVLKLMPGPDHHRFSRLDLARLVNSCYRVSGDSDSMGYRLDGPALDSPGGVTSRGVSCGTVQVPGNGKPIVLLNDCQTIGGYPVIGTVPRLDCSRLAQCSPGASVGFRWSDVAECQGERMVFEEQLRTWTWDEYGRLIRRSG